MFHVAGFAVPLHQPHPDADELAVALRRHQMPVAQESRLVEVAACLPFGEIGFHHPVGERRRDGHARVLHQRCHVIGRRADHRVLEIDEANPVQSLALSAPDDVRRVKISQEQVRLGGLEKINQPVPDLSVFTFFVIACRRTALPRQVPVGQKPRLDLHRRPVEIRNAVDDRSVEADLPVGLLGMEAGEQSYAFDVALVDRLAGRVENAIRPKVLDQQDALVEIAGVDRRRCKAACNEQLVDRDEGNDVFGDMRELLVVFSVLEDGAGLVSWRIHQNPANGAVCRVNALIGPDRGVAAEVPAPCVWVIVLIEEVADRQRAGDALQLFVRTGNFDAATIAFMGDAQRDAAGG
ncbi:hypothetical protein D9M70_475920 [compost metagenome]